GPVYTWLLKIFLEAFGYHIYSVTLLKELFIFGIYALTFLNVRCITGSYACAVAAAVAVQFNPSISWESHRELTHSIAASFFVLGAVYALVRLRSTTTGERKFYVLFAVCVALGTLSKYNFG